MSYGITKQKHKTKKNKEGGGNRRILGKPAEITEQRPKRVWGRERSFPNGEKETSKRRGSGQIVAF